MANDYYLEVIKELKKFSRLPKKNDKQSYFDPNKYLGTPKPFLFVKTSLKRKVVKNFLRHHPEMTLPEFCRLLDRLYYGKTFDELSVAGMFLEYAPKFRAKIKLPQLDRWFSRLEGWAEVDSSCQSTFRAEELLAKWVEWKKFLLKLSRDRNINKRRASLVLLVKSVGKLDDKRLADLAFQNIEQLKGEREVLITKAISWLLRALVVNHKNRVSAYLDTNADLLPKIAIRETRRKIETGKK